MSVKERLSASVDADLVAAAQEAVAQGRAESVSAWVNEALRLKAEHDQRLRALEEFVTAFEAEHGEITEAEMREAARRARPERADRESAGPPEVLVLDAGAFVAVERGDRDMMALIKREQLTGRVPVSHGGVVAQVWRGGSGRQVPVARLLAGVDIAALDDGLGRRAGMLLARTGLADAVDAAVVALAGDGDDILTSDPGDLRALAQAAGVHVELIPV